MTNRIKCKFDELKQKGDKALIGYLTAGDPDLKRSERNIRTALRNGMDILEIGVPFSDPTADGPTIQEAGQRALASGITLRKILSMARNLRRSFNTPMVLFSYANPIFSYGYEKLCADAVSAGIDAFLLVDMPFEESDEIRSAMRSHGLQFIPLIAPTTPRARAKAILSEAEGFVYYILVKGVTGTRDNLPSEARAHLKELRRCTKLPIAVGFGISNGKQARLAAEYADAVVVGSALIKAARAGKLAMLVRELADAVHQ